MTTKPSEKATEMLFNHYLLQMFSIGEVSLFAPSSVEEYLSGYDTKIIGAKSFQEMYLQFKSPSYRSSITNRSTIRTSQGYTQQHHLLKSYPPHTTYYLSHTFNTVKEMLEAQRNTKKPEDFLKHYIAVEVSQLPFDITYLHHSIDYKGEDIIGAGYMRTSIPGIQPLCLRGDELVKRFKHFQVGVHVKLIEKGDRGFVKYYEDDRVWYLTSDKIAEMCAENTDSEFGIVIRTNLRNQPETGAG